MSEEIKFEGLVQEGTPRTYGGVTRAKVPEGSLKYDSTGGQLTIEMLKNGFEFIKRMDEAEEEWQREFYKALHPYSHLATSDFDCYCAIYRLFQSSRSPISKPFYDKLMEIVKSRGIDLWPSKTN